jgi:hypothetical protein
MDVLDLDEVGEKVEYHGEEWTPDTAHNIIERKKSWEINEKQDQGNC